MAKKVEPAPVPRMPDRVLHPPGGRRKIGPSRRRDAKTGLDAPATKVGVSTAGVTVWAETALGEAGTNCALAVLKGIDALLSKLNSLFGMEEFSGESVIVANLGGANDGTGGAYHSTCESRTYYVDCDALHPERTLALAVAEASEARQAEQGTGWDCGASPGEGLSRFHAELLCPGTLDDYATFGLWLDSAERTDFVSEVLPSDTDDLANGCSVGFLWWLVAAGDSPADITQAKGHTLAEIWAALGGMGDAWEEFSQACEAKWPAGSPAGIATDNPWEGKNGGGEPGPEPTPAPKPQGGLKLTLDADFPAGEYTLSRGNGGNWNSGGIPREKLDSIAQQLADVAGQLAELLRSQQHSPRRGEGEKPAPK